ncbi:myosin-1-like [Passer domesticus]|uniref:myosin-1-like n=2 Tax=Passer domesticus TaxID=48849 RepID=UPI0030FE289C
METRRGARGLSHQGRSSRAPEVLVDNRDSMANSNICTDNPGNILSTQTSTDKQHPCQLVREATENCVRMWQQFDQMEESTQRIRGQYQLIDTLLEEIRSDCANLEKSREMLLQCTGIPEPGALRLHQQNTKQRKEASAQEEKAEQQDWMEVSQEEEPSSCSREQLSWESSDQGHAATQAWREEELLGQKAELEGRLAATEWLQQDLSRQLAETRSAKESLESKLFAAQQQIAQLEMSRKRVEAELQAELQKAHREVQAAQRRHKAELQGLKKEINLVLAHREALQKQVAELTSQLAACRECQEKTVQRAQQDVREAQQESRQKLSEVEHVQKLLEEAEHWNKELQAHLDYLESKWIQWEEVAQQNSELQASVNALEREKARLILTVEEKNLCLRTLEEQNMVLKNSVSQCQSALQETEQLYSEHRRELMALNTRAWALLEAVREKAACQETREKQLATEASELCVRLQSSEERAEAMATQCKAMELELQKTRAERDNLRARNQELLKQLEQCEKEWVQAEAMHISRQILLDKEATERQEEAVTLRQEVASLKRKLENLEKERKDVLHEQELYQQHMRYLEKENEMPAPEMPNDEENTQELEVEREDMPEELEHGAAALKKLRDNTQVLSAALNKSDIAKGALKKRLDILKGKIQAGRGIGFQSSPVSLNYSSGVSHEEVSQEEESSSWSLEQLSWESSDQGHAAAQACREEELLGQKAELEGRLAATEWLQQDLSRQLAETRSAKESLESRLFAAQQQIAQLEMSRKRVEAELQAELQEARSEVQAAQRRHKEELQGLKQEINLVLAYREALQKQVAELTSQLAACRECQEKTVQRAQQDVREAQQESRQKLSEVEHVQKLLEEAEHRNKELQVHPEYLESKWIQWEEMARQNSELQASVNALEREKARLILTVEEKNLCLRTLEEQNMVLKNSVSQCQSALQETEQLYSEHRRELMALNTRAWALLEAVREKAACQETREKQLATEASELCVRLQSSEERAEAIASQCKAMELELRKRQAERDNLRARNKELLKQLEQTMLRAEHLKISLECSQKKDTIAQKEEDVILRHSLQKKLENLEKERNHVQHEQELYQQHMRYLEKENEMHEADMQSQKEQMQQLGTEKETKLEEWEHGAAALQKWREYAQILSAALNKSEIAKGALKKRLDILKGKIQAGRGIDFQSIPVPLNYSSGFPGGGVIELVSGAP